MSAQALSHCTFRRTRPLYIAIAKITRRTRMTRTIKPSIDNLTGKNSSYGNKITIRGVVRGVKKESFPGVASGWEDAGRWPESVPFAGEGGSSCRCGHRSWPRAGGLASLGRHDRGPAGSRGILKRAPRTSAPPGPGRGGPVEVVPRGVRDGPPWREAQGGQPAGARCVPLTWV